MPSTKYDIAIVGAGIVGLAHAWMAAKQGLSVAVLEKNSPCTGDASLDREISGR